LAAALLTAALSLLILLLLSLPVALVLLLLFLPVGLILLLLVLAVSLILLLLVLTITLILLLISHNHSPGCTRRRHHRTPAGASNVGKYLATPVRVGGCECRNLPTLQTNA
jgi:hypothetical protein